MLIDRLLFRDRAPLVMTKSLDAQSARHLLVSNNISNADTPGYKAKDMDFQNQLRSALGSANKLDLRATQENHFGPSRQAIKNMEFEVFQEPDAAKSNGNNVNIDKEMAKLAENQIMYNAITQLMMKRGSTVRSAVTELAQQ